MSKVSVTGPKKHMREVIEELHKAGVMDINEYEGELETGNPFEEGDQLSETLVEIRSVLSKLPERESDIETSIPLESLDDKVKQVSEKLEELRGKEDRLKSEKENLEDRADFFRKLQGVELDYEDLDGTETIGTIVTDVSRSKFDSELNGESVEFYEGRDLNVVVYDRRDTEEVEAAIRRSGSDILNVPEIDYRGSIESVVSKLESDIRELEEEKKNVESDIQNLADNNYVKLKNTEEFLTEKVEKAEAPLKFATTDHAFIIKGWVPTERFGELNNRLNDITKGKIHIQEEEQGDEEPPVKQKNNGLVAPFESLTNLVSRPQYNELDPSIILMLTFPLFFGFMIGDAGYGITSLAVFYGGYKMFPQAKNIFKSLMYASVATIAFGLAFGDVFGYIIFGHESILAHEYGLHIFSQIPILLYHRVGHYLTTLKIAAVIGAIHINIGFMIGVYNEYIRHGFKAALMEKGSWILLQAAVLVGLFVNIPAGAAVGLLAFGMLLKGEGVQGVVEIPSLISSILSYLRIFGVSVAAVVLAMVVKKVAKPLLISGSAAGLLGGVLILMIGHTFNTFIKIMEGFLQGIRLHYVEMFDTFYNGGGRKYTPFGGDT